jgi:hypothetical protein
LIGGLITGEDYEKKAVAASKKRDIVFNSKPSIKKKTDDSSTPIPYAGRYPVIKEKEFLTQGILHG